MKIAILGGAFNPVHREHVNLATEAVKKLGLDKIIIMPTAISPHKGGRLSADFWQRYEMCRIAFSSVPQAEVSNYELTRGGVSYTYLTCEHFARIYRDAERYFIIGSDMLESFPQWRNPERILASFTLVACARENKTGFAQAKKSVEEKFGVRVVALPYVGEKVSSTEIRTLACLGEDFKGFVNDGVWQYIEERGLYRVDGPDGGGLSGVKKLLKPDRWAHTVRVAVLCAKNASRAGLTESQAVTMGALHDCAKNLPADSPLLSGFIPPENVAPPVMHQFSGAFVAENHFGLKDKILLDAIACHTTGRANMTDADALLFLADLLEEGRDFDGVDELRRLFKTDLRLCLFKALERQLCYLESTGAPVDGRTLSAYNSIKEELL